MKYVWVGFHSEGVDAFAQAVASGANITLFVTFEEAKASARSSASSDYIPICEANHISILYVDTIKGERAYQAILGQSPDVLIVIGWSEILPERLLGIPSVGTVGTHASLLPHNRGSAPVNWAIIKGEAQSGNSMMWLDKEIDKGRIIDQIPVDITPFDTCKTVYEKVADANSRMILTLIKRLEHGEGTVMDLPNETDEVALPRRRPKDGLIDWNQDAIHVYNFIRALAKPYPGAFSFLEGEKALIWQSSLLPIEGELGAPGQILGPVYGCYEGASGVCVACAKGAVVVHCLETKSDGELCDQKLAASVLNGVFNSEGKLE